MQISDALIEGIFNHARESGHPDPLGFVARMKVESNFDPDKVGKNGEVGLNQIAPKRAARFGLQDIDSIEGNIDSAIQIDFSHFEKVGQNLEKMYIAWRIGLNPEKLNAPTASVKRWLKKIESESKKLAKLLGITQDVRREKSKEERDINRETREIYSGNRFTAESVSGSPVNREIAVFFPEAAESSLDVNRSVAPVQPGSTLVANNRPVQTQERERMIGMIIQLIDRV